MQRAPPTRSTRSQVIFGLALFAVGCMAGIAWAERGDEQPGVSPALQPAASDAITVPDPPALELSPRRGVTPAAPPSAATNSGDAALAAVFERLDNERAERERIDAELRRVRAQLAALSSRLESVALADPAAARGPGTRNRESRRVDQDALLDAGFGVDEAAGISERWGLQQMALLELRDQATREGWITSDRYNEALRELSRGEQSLRGSLDEDDYDRFLYAAGRSNRIRVEEVIESSPAQAAGLQPGDVLIRYGDTRLYGYGDLRAATQAGEAGADTLLEIERDGVPMEVTVPRGPVGVQIDALTVEPQ